MFNVPLRQYSVDMASNRNLIRSDCDVKQHPSESDTNRSSLGLRPTTVAALRAFVAERDWDQFHSPENLAKSISIEAAELLELYQWNATPDQARVEEELADVLTYCIHLANKIGVDLDEILLSKLEKTQAKYPVELAKGRMTKYTELAKEQELSQEQE